jgi:hypothetical protein
MTVEAPGRSLNQVIQHSYRYKNQNQSCFSHAFCFSVMAGLDPAIRENIRIAQSSVCNR